MAQTIRWTEDELAAYLARFGKAKTETDSAVFTANLESAKRPKPKRKNEGKGIHPQYRIHVHSRRRRATDADGVSIKAAIDGLCRGGILTDDSPDFVPQTPTQSQKRSPVEETIIEVWEIE